MNKYFYPIYKMKIKPWIKYWLLKKLNDSGESRLKVVTISSGTLKKVDTSKSLSIKEYYGNTVQNGTPTPEEPVEIQTITGNITFNINSVNYSLDLKSKNLFDEKFRQGNRFTVGLTDTTRLFTVQNYPVKSGITYTISTTLDISIYKYGINLSIQPYPIQNVTPSPQFYDSGWQYGSSFTFTPSQDGYFGMTIAKLNGSDSLTPSDISSYTWQLEEGSTPTPYESYYNYELCKIGEYQDRIYKENDKWYIEKQVSKVVLNGTETWGGTPNYYTSILQSVIAPTLATERIIALSNNFLVQGYNYKSSNNLYFHPNKNLQIENSNGTYYATVNDWKTWLSNNNTTVYYILAESTTNEITNTNLISQLNDLYQFYVQSSTVSISNNSEIPLEVLLEYYGR